MGRGVPLHVVQKLTGHKSLGSLGEYLAATDAEVLAAIVGSCSHPPPKLHSTTVSTLDFRSFLLAVQFSKNTCPIGNHHQPCSWLS
jgi:hypothetical protein